MTRQVRRLWLNGERAGEHHLLDIDGGTVVETLRIGREIRPTAGMGRRCGRHFIAVYVDLDGESVVLQVDQHRFPLDGETTVRHRSALRGLLSELTILRPGMPPVRLRKRGLASAVLRRVDPAYDELDASADDFLADVADVAASQRRLDWIREVKNPLAGPWEALP